MSDPLINAAFPKILAEGYRVTSPKTNQYNCIAWAIEIDSKWFWPDQMGQFYWPSDIPREATLQNFELLYKKYGYEVCDNSLAENGYLKIIVYVDSLGKPTHASRQLLTGKWTSKLGQSQDIEHNTPDALFGDAYGNIGLVMKKQI